MSSNFRNFLITRLLLTIPMILILVSVVFFIMRVLRVIRFARNWGRVSVNNRPRHCESISD
jgi:ABC-type dipeptide/oligopeptide/nickel transport system permease component